MKIRYWYLWKGGEDLTGSAPYAAIFELYILVRERFRATTRMGCNDTRTIVAELDSMCERCGSHHIKESESRKPRSNSVTIYTMLVHCVVVINTML
jgi:hypothetical protein